MLGCRRVIMFNSDLAEHGAPAKRAVIAKQNRSDPPQQRAERCRRSPPAATDAAKITGQARPDGHGRRTVLRPRSVMPTAKIHRIVASSAATAACGHTSRGSSSESPPPWASPAGSRARPPAAQCGACAEAPAADRDDDRAAQSPSRTPGTPGRLIPGSSPLGRRRGDRGLGGRAAWTAHPNHCDAAASFDLFWTDQNCQF